MRPVLDHPFFEAHPALADLSSYAMSVAGPPRGRPDHQHRGAFAVGNGAMFALMGLSDPLNTLHSAVGPVYDKRERFFGDVAIELEEDGEVAAFEREWIARVRSTAVNVTRADTRFSSVYTVDFAPHSRGSPPVIVRFILGGMAHLYGRCIWSRARARGPCPFRPRNGGTLLLGSHPTLG